jgi:Arc/MetJ-type ribon-helix-helix transcriptional regulator
MKHQRSHHRKILPKERVDLTKFFDAAEADVVEFGDYHRLRAEVGRKLSRSWHEVPRGVEVRLLNKLNKVIMMGRVVPVVLEKEDVERIEEVRRRFGFRSRSEVVREAVRRFLDEVPRTRVVRVRGMTKERAKREILRYLREHGSAYVDDIALELGIDLDLAFEAARELQEEGVVG